MTSPLDSRGFGSLEQRPGTSSVTILNPTIWAWVAARVRGLVRVLAWFLGKQKPEKHVDRDER